MKRLKDSDLITLLGKVARAGKTRGAGADHSNLMTVAFRLYGCLCGIGIVPVGDKTLKATDRHGLTLNTSHAVLFALGLLGTYTTAHRRKRAGLRNDLIRALKIALGDLGDKIGNADIDGTSSHTGAVLTIQASLCLVDRLLLGVTQRHLKEVGISYIGCLRGHLVFLQ